MDRTHIRYIFIYTFSYMAIGSMMPLIGRYLAQEGFTGAQIGTVTAAGTLVAIFASAFWGGVFDRCQNGRKVVRTLCICGTYIWYIPYYICGNVFLPGACHGTC